MKILGFTELFIATLLWGYGFIATVFALRGVGPIWVTTLRFGIAGVVCLVIIAVMKQRKCNFSKTEILTGLIPGLLLALTLVLQTCGMLTTTATKSGFITVLYIVFVPLIEQLFYGIRPGKGHYRAVLIALLGMMLVSKLEIHEFSIGDFLTLLCAVTAALHIIVVGKASRRIRSPFVFNTWQTVWAAAMMIPLALTLESAPAFPIPAQSVFGLAFLVFCSTMIAFVLQIRAQRVLSTSVASILFLLESPFAALFAAVILKERFAPLQWIGAAFIMAAAVDVTFQDFRRKNLEQQKDPSDPLLSQENLNQKASPS